jgi:hypothetical protein
MSTILKIKRSSGTSAPSSLAQGELAYTYGTGTQGNFGDRLFIGTGTETDGAAANIDIIGGKYFTSITDHAAGTLTASSAILVDSNKAIDELFIGNSASIGGTIKFNEGTNNGTNFVALKAPNDVTTSHTITLPASAGTNGQFLKVDGDGVLSFADVDTTLTFVDDSSTTVDIPSSQSITISGGTGLTSSISGSTITLNLDNTTVSAGSYGSATEVPTFTVDAQGRLTAASSVTIATSFNIADDSSSTITVNGGSTLKIAGGTGITSSVSGQTITLDIDGTVVTESSSDTLTNKSISLSTNTITGTSAELATAISDETGTGSLVFANTPTLVTPNIGAATGTSLNLTNINLESNGNATIAGTLAANGGITVDSTNFIVSGSTGAITTLSTLDLGHASDTTLSRSSAGVLAVEGVVVPTISSSNTLTNKTISGSDNTISNIGNSSLTNSSVTIGTTSISLGATSTTLAGITQLDVDNVRVDGNTISSTDTDGNLTLSPNGSGDINLSADTIVVGDSNTNATITTNGTGNLVLNTNNGTNAGSITLHQGADGNINLTPNGQGVVKVPSGYLDRTQLDANSLVTKAYVDAVQQGLHVHESVKVATTTQLTNLIGSSTVTYSNGTDGVGATLTLGAAITQIDGYNLINGDRILVKDELNYAHNGIYIRTNSTLLTRATDFDSGIEVASGDFLFVQEGTVNGNNGFVQTEVCNTLGTDDILFTQFSGAGQIIAGDGLLKTGNELDVVVDNTTIEINTDELRVKDAGITAAKLATDAVETSKIADSAVTNVKLANSVIYFTDESSTQGSVSLGGNIEFLAGEGIDTTVVGNTVRISGELATSSNAGVAFFPTANFLVTTGSVAITKIDGGTF